MKSVSSIDGKRSSYSKNKALGEARRSEKTIFIQWGDMACSRIYNILEELETEEIKLESAKDFLAKLKRKFKGGNDKSAKIAKLKQIQQDSRS